MKKGAEIIAVTLIVLFLMFVSCSPSGGPGAVADDPVSTRSGIYYRADVLQRDKSERSVIPQTEVTLEALSGTIGIKYRDYIETKTGETKHNIIYLNAHDSPELLDPLHVNYHSVGLPNGIVIQRDGQMYGGFGQNDSRLFQVVLMISITPDIVSAEYPITISLEYEGKEIGSLPCMIKVIE
jgi:hypothetical protein